jgi:hypothetical protein
LQFDFDFWHSSSRRIKNRRRRRRRKKKRKKEKRKKKFYHEFCGEISSLKRSVGNDASMSSPISGTPYSKNKLNFFKNLFKFYKTMYMAERGKGKRKKGKGKGKREKGKGKREKGKGKREKGKGKETRELRVKKERGGLRGISSVGRNPKNSSSGLWNSIVCTRL